MSRTDDRAAALSREQLLARAAHCYEGAGRDLQACHCLEMGGDHARAALIHERAARWREAARCFERAERWVSAGRCHLEASQPVDAARCHQAAGQQLEAAWILAHHARHAAQAEASLAGMDTGRVDQELGRLLVLARCAMPRMPAVAARLLRQVFARLGELGPSHGRDQVMNWAFTLASEVLDRPDLTIELLVAGWHAQIDTRQRWEQWAQVRLGNGEAVALLKTGGDDDTPPVPPHDQVSPP